MRNICVIASSPLSLVNFRGELLKTMKRRGHRVYTLAPAQQARNMDDVRQDIESLGVKFIPISLHRRGISPVRDIHTLSELTTLLQHLEIDVVLSYTPKPVIYGSLAARKAQITESYSLISGLGYAFSSRKPQALPIRWLTSHLYRRSVRYNRRIFFQNPDDRNLFEKLGVIQTPEQAVLVNGSGVDLEFFSPDPLPKSLSFLLIARLIEEKGVRQYVDAARLIKQTHPEVKFRLVGQLETGAHRIPKAEVDQWVREGTIEYLGTVSDVRPVIRDSSVFVLPTYYREGQPRTILEAMSMARAIITTDNPGSRETVTNGVNGFLVPPKDVSALEATMLRFVEDPNILQSMAEASREIAVKRYDVHKVNKIMLDKMNL